jgi:DNA repair protein RecN (Recombination protein N)
MLRHLIIRDFVIIDVLELDFQPGFGTLTGETGAGKSILLDALGLVLGKRAETVMVRPGCEKADLSAEFDLPDGFSALKVWLDDAGIDAPEGRLLIRRTLDALGRSRSWINGIAVTLTQLRDVAGWLLDLHGQHAHQALLRSDAQRSLFDQHSGLQRQATLVSQHYGLWQKTLKAMESARENQLRLQEERELLRFQVEELQALNLEPGYWPRLESEQARLSHAATLIETSERALDRLDEGDMALIGQLSRLVLDLQALSVHDPELNAVVELLEGAHIQLDEAFHTLRRYRERLETDPQRLHEADTRMALLTSLARKYRQPADQLDHVLKTLKGRLESLEAQSDPERLAEIERLERERFMAVAESLSSARAKAAERLSAEVTAVMQTLGLPGACFEVALVPLETPCAQGLERIEFQVSANAGQPLRPLAKVASGGELSRIGLAIQVLTSQSQHTPTLIFDEVDAGIGGRVAEMVGQLLKRLGQTRQVMCVTHLPQVAACANWQWRIRKETREGHTFSQVEVLDYANRIEEIARMLGGAEITNTTREHAAELLMGVDGQGQGANDEKP